MRHICARKCLASQLLHAVSTNRFGSRSPSASGISIGDIDLGQGQKVANGKREGYVIRVSGRLYPRFEEPLEMVVVNKMQHYDVDMLIALVGL